MKTLLPASKKRGAAAAGTGKKNSGMLSPSCVLHLMMYCLNTGYDDLYRKQLVNNNMSYALMLLFNLYEGGWWVSCAISCM
jgi:predicted nucleic-acid-binding Zn-ribbon protein